MEKTQHIDPATCRVAVVAGGKSTEREISIASGRGACKALTEAGFPITLIDPADEGQFARLTPEWFDVAFLCLHGKGGEDGTIQYELERRGLIYTGSGVEASEKAINKAFSKRIYHQVGIPTPPCVYLAPSDNLDADVLVHQVGLPCVVKAACEGSTIGCYILGADAAAADVESAVREAFLHDDTVLVEQYVPGEEFTVACLGNDEPEALPVIKIVPKNAFYDFESKYAPGGSEHLCPAPIDEELTSRLQRYACDAHRALGCAGMSRTDFIVDGEGGVWALETNTIPGMTETSLLPDAAHVAGMSFAETCAYLIELAFKR